MSKKQIEFVHAGDVIAAPAILSKGILRVAASEGSEAVEYDVVQHGDTEYRLIGADRTIQGYAQRLGDEVWVHVDGRTFHLEVSAAAGGRRRGAGAAKDEILAPMTGTVRKIMVSEGAEVTAGTPAIVLEAMKMEHVLPAPRDGKVAEVRCREGEQAEAQSILLLMAPEAEGE